jgi:hypothetical protein
MKSRLVILTTLVLGMLLSTAGAGLAVSGLSGVNGNAAQTQYPSPGGGNVLGDQDSGAGNDVLPQENGGGGGGTNPSSGGGSGIQPSRQVEAGADTGGSGSLPFTGFAAIPILFGGLVLLGSGLVLRSRAGQR